MRVQRERRRCPHDHSPRQGRILSLLNPAVAITVQRDAKPKLYICRFLHVCMYCKKSILHSTARRVYEIIGQIFQFYYYSSVRRHVEHGDGVVLCLVVNFRIFIRCIT